MRSDLLNKNSGSYMGKDESKIFSWDYISCGNVNVQDLATPATGVLATGDKFSMLFPHTDGHVQSANAVSIGAFAAATGIVPNVEGTVPATDTNSTVAGLILQMGSAATDNVGLEIVPGGSQLGSNSNKFVVGTHQGYIDVTFYNVDWSDYDNLSIGFRKAEDFQVAHGPVVAASSGDPVYTDYVAFGCISPDDVQISTDIGNTGDETTTDTTDATAAAGNHRFRINLSPTGVVTYQHIGAAVMRAGTLAYPSTTTAYTFTSGLTLVPYITCVGINQDSAVYLKSVDIVRSPAISGRRKNVTLS
jgi:hypothetical protein